MDDETLVDVQQTELSVFDALASGAPASEAPASEAPTSVQIDVSQNVSVYSGVIPSDVLSVARDLVAGCRDDYYFSDLDSDSYFLIIAKGGINDEMQASDCICYQLDSVEGSSGYRSVFLTSHEFEHMEINNALNLLSYSSEEGFPKLTQGGSMYEFATLGLLGIFAASWLFDRIFSHVGNKG